MWKEHQLCSVSNLSSPTSCLHGLTGATPLPELHSPVWGGGWGLLPCPPCRWGACEDLHPRVLKLEGTLESPGVSFKHVGRSPERPL